MDKKIIILSFLLVLVSCSSVYSRNSLSEGDVVFKKGKLGDVNWDTELEFKRYSLYKDFNLSFDVLVSEVETKSDFFRWFSIDEKNEIRKCKKAYLFLNYSGEGGLKHVEFEEQLKTQAYKKIYASKFHKNLKKHPSFNDFNLGRYELLVACGEGKLNLVAYGFPKINLN